MNIVKKIFQSYFYENGKPGTNKLFLHVLFWSFVAMCWIAFFTGRQVPTQLVVALSGFTASTLGVKIIGIARKKNEGKKDE